MCVCAHARSQSGLFDLDRGFWVNQKLVLEQNRKKIVRFQMDGERDAAENVNRCGCVTTFLTHINFKQLTKIIQSSRQTNSLDKRPTGDHWVVWCWFAFLAAPRLSGVSITQYDWTYEELREAKERDGTAERTQHDTTPSRSNKGKEKKDVDSARTFFIFWCHLFQFLFIIRFFSSSTSFKPF